ncbi:MAG: N-acetylmuramoyl-L-alanine amidase [Candidatus Heimdallarchaeota archaeon]|nr:N-acetylmuramoyl-L-alanine amidase [Candidatus Heimdallarchaeota archaeon]
MKNICYLFALLIITTLVATSCMKEKNNPLAGKIICIDPGHGGTAETDSFRVGPYGEREEWMNLRVVLKLANLLKEAGATAVLTRASDESVELKARADLAIQNKADVFVSIHHNATADTAVNFPIIYYHGNASENQASIYLGRLLAKNIRTKLFDKDTPVSLISDHVIFPGSGAAVLRYSYGIPGVIGEASFFTNPREEERLKSDEYNQREAEAYYHTLKEYFKYKSQPILEKYSIIKLPGFEVFQEADRMDTTALLWKQDYEEGTILSKSSDTDSIEDAISLLSRSVRSFPDSWLAREAHISRGDIMKKLGRSAEADTALLRANEFYVEVD